MKRNFLKQAVFSIAIITLLASCGGGGGGGGSSSGGAGTSKVTIAIGGDVRIARISANKSAFLAGIQRFFRKLMPDSAIALMPSNVYKIKVTISASDLATPITGAFNVTPGGADLVATFDVPNGKGRYFLIEEEDNTGHLVYRGDTKMDLNGGTVDVPVTSKNINTVVQDFLNSFATVFNKGTALSSADLEPFYATDSTFGIDSGWNRTQAINDMLKDPPTNVKKITSVTVLSLTPNSDGSYRVDGAAYFDDGSQDFPEDGFTVIHEGGSLKFKGNGYKSEVRITAEAHKWTDLLGWTAFGYPSITQATGFNIEIKDKGNWGLQYARVTGPGLPGYVNASNQGGGVTFTKVGGANNDNSLALDSQASIPTDKWSLFVILPANDSVLDGVPDNASYAVTIMDAATNIVEKRAVILPKRPYKNSELGALGMGAFPPLLSINGHAPTSMDNSISAANIGGTLTFSSNKPAAFTPTSLKAELNYWSGGATSYSSYTDKDLLLGPDPISGSITTVAPSGWTPSQGHLVLTARDSDRRSFSSHWMFQ
ncbi:MAG: hypothetical protein M1353_06615 [Nitrospirae bacterium]|nr:hypothetical protein [Nitrospirota bacterium]